MTNDFSGNQELYRKIVLIVQLSMLDMSMSCLVNYYLVGMILKSLLRYSLKL